MIIQNRNLWMEFNPEVKSEFIESLPLEPYYRHASKGLHFGTGFVFTVSAMKLRRSKKTINQPELNLVKPESRIVGCSTGVQYK